MISYTPSRYWTELAESFSDQDRKGFSPVLHPGAPDWFNLTIDRLQERAWLRALSFCKLREGAAVLDLGCGTGRWLRRYPKRGYSAIGVDGSVSMLKRAVELKTLAPLLGARLQLLPFRDRSFDCVSAVTVIQHIPAHEQQRAIEEIVRVVRPGGYIVLLELIRGQALHVFSRRPSEWIQRVRSCGPELISWFGQEFLLLDRMVTSAVSLGKRVLFGFRTDSLPVHGDTVKNNLTSGRSSLKGLYWGARRFSVGVSAWVEPLAARICPQDWATHAAFVFRKPL